MKHHKLALTFNKPQNPKTKISIAAHLLGKEYYEIKERMEIYENVNLNWLE